MACSPPIYIWITSDLWLHLILFLNGELMIHNKQLIVINHTCYYSRSEIKSQANSKPSFNVLATRELLLGTEVYTHKTNLIQLIKCTISPSQQKKEQTQELVLLQVSNICYAQNRVWPHLNCKCRIDNKKLLVQTHAYFYS